MKTHRLLFVLVAGLALLFSAQAYADPARDDIVHAYVLLKMANANYAGHRDKAIKELEQVGHELGMDLNGRGADNERQMKSDGQMAEAARILHEARNRLDARDREHAASHVDRAISEIELALRKK
ncbi:MAG TPA: hypothetical protein VHC44_05590 [Verrucomicrobiae bacterium]|nr:hypothetical protein [Verrucomicrobiae bacterium]